MNQYNFKNGVAAILLCQKIKITKAFESETDLRVKLLFSTSSAIERFFETFDENRLAISKKSLLERKKKEDIVSLEIQRCEWSDIAGIPLYMNEAGINITYDDLIDNINYRTNISYSQNLNNNAPDETFNGFQTMYV